MTIGIGYFIGGLFLVLYGIMCLYIGYGKPKTLFKITKIKLGKKRSDEEIVKICYTFGTITFIIGIIVFISGYINA